MSPSSRRRSRFFVASSSRAWLPSLRAVRSRALVTDFTRSCPRWRTRSADSRSEKKSSSRAEKLSRGMLSVSGPYWSTGRKVKSTGLPSRTRRYGVK